MSFVASKTTEKQCEKIYNFSPFFLLQRNVTHILESEQNMTFFLFSTFQVWNTIVFLQIIITIWVTMRLIVQCNWHPHGKLKNTHRKIVWISELFQYPWTDWTWKWTHQLTGKAPNTPTNLSFYCFHSFISEKGSSENSSDRLRDRFVQLFR